MSPAVGPPPDDELIFGLVAPLGVDLGQLEKDLRAALGDFGYRSHVIHITDAFADFDWPTPLREEPFDERVWSYMDAGDRLCKKWKSKAAMAMLATAQIAATRVELTGDVDLPPSRTAYILRSLKRPEEVELLRNVYGRRFFLIGAAADETQRLHYLDERIRHSRIPPHDERARHSAADLIRRDEADERAKYGQNVRDTFHRADLFLAVGPSLPREIARALDAIHGDPKRAPSKDELGMMHAATAALRSAELGRQVGAAVCDADGALVATGANEVPKAFGGQYWEGEPDDARDIQREHDTNTVKRRAIAQEIEAALSSKRLLKDGIKPNRVLRVVEASHFGDVIEYVRAVHAEMAAITDAARRGVRVSGDTLYSTTFPCHHCARHILAAGIARVVYIAPYAKSLAVDLHGDAIAIGAGADGKLPFEPFIGVGPRRFASLFIHEDRKSAVGTLRRYNRKTAPARIEDRDPSNLRSDLLPYLRRERRAEGMLAEAETRSRFKMRRS